MLQKLFHHLKSFNHKMNEDNVGAFSAQAAFFIIISFFPFIMFLLTLIQYLPFPESVVMETVSSVMPQAFKGTVISLIQEIYNKSAGTVISLTVISALWSASRGFVAIIKGLNSIYQICETRNGIRLRITSTIYTIVFALMLIATLGFLVFGNRLYVWIERKFPLLNHLALVIISIRTIVGLLFLFLFFLILFLAVPDRKSSIFTEVPGAALAAGGWLTFSYLYSFYIDTVANSPSNMYGSLTAIVLLMLWLYACMSILFIGAETNVFLNHRKKSKKANK